MNRKKRNMKKSLSLMIVAVLLLIGSAVGSTRAALGYYSNEYIAEVEHSEIGITLLENGKSVGTGSGSASTTDGTLLANLLGDDEKVQLGKQYDEVLSVQNSGTIDNYVRVILRKSWVDEKGVKDPTLSPELIDLKIEEGNGWIVDKQASTPERTVLYYSGKLASGQSTKPFTSKLTIDPEVGKKLTETKTTDENGYTVYTYEYEYDGYTFNIQVEADAVQTHHAKDAIKSAWGIDVNVSDGGSISL